MIKRVIISNGQRQHVTVVVSGAHGCVQKHIRSWGPRNLPPAQEAQNKRCGILHVPSVTNTQVCKCDVRWTHGQTQAECIKHLADTGCDITKINEQATHHRSYDHAQS